MKCPETPPPPRDSVSSVCPFADMGGGGSEGGLTGEEDPGPGEVVQALNLLHLATLDSYHAFH